MIGLGAEFTACWGELTLVGALTSFTVSDVYGSFLAYAQSLAPRIRSRVEYLTPGDNFTVPG